MVTTTLPTSPAFTLVRREPIGCLLLIFSLFFVVQAQDAQSKTYRGTLGDKHIEMRLTMNGGKANGSYFYDRFRQDIPLEGEYNTNGQLELTEGSGKKKTGKFICKRESETSDVDLDCEWSRVNGTGKTLVYLLEQGLRLKGDSKIVPKLILNRKTQVDASYPQLTASVITPAISEFNRLIESRLQEAIKDFESAVTSKALFDTTYNVLFADDARISVEMVEYSDVGAAHPNTRLWTLNYDLKANRELTLDDVFNPGDDYKAAIAEFAAKDISRRAVEIEKEEARRNNRQPEKRDEPFMSENELPEMDTWGLSPKGFVVYFDFPHVIAVFTKTVVPYGVVARYLKPNGVVPLIK